MSLSKGSNIFEIASYTEWKGINRQAPSFIFIDLDRSAFNDERALELALKRLLKKLKEKFGGAHPTVLWSGNGHHIYQPIDAIILEQYDIFSEFEYPSKVFLNMDLQVKCSMELNYYYLPWSLQCANWFPTKKRRNNGSKDRIVEPAGNVRSNIVVHAAN